MKKLTCSFITALVVVLSLTPSLFAEQTTFEISSGAYEIVSNAQGMQEIQMLEPGYSPIPSPGNPALPQKILEFQLPAGADPANVRLQYEIIESSEVTDIDLAPVPPQGPVAAGDSEEYDRDELDWGPDKSIVEGKNVFVYDKDATYPAAPAELLTVSQRKVPTVPGPKLQQPAGPPEGSFQNAGFAVFSYRPFLYNPVQKKLTHIARLNVIISYYSGPVISIEEPKYAPLSNGNYDYVIITTNDIVANSERLDDFIYLKKLYGHNVLTVTESQYGSLTGQAPNGTAEKIRQWLKNNYLSMGINYVLLIGDPDPDDPTNPSDTVGDVPMKMCWPRYTAYTYRESPTDYFYADLTGNWDLDGDQYFGETLDVTHERSPDPSIGENYFSVRWTGKLQCDYTESYEFHTFSDDGVRLYIDGSLIIDHWTEHLPASDYATRSMTAGKHDIRVEFRENTGDGIIQLWWRTKVPKTDPHFVDHRIIPQTHLYDASDNVGGLTGTYYNNTSLTGTPSLTRKDNVVNFAWAQGDRGTGGIDSGAEVFVGRIPVYNQDYIQLDEILGKIIEYETDSGDISWRRSILLPMKPLWDDTPSYHLGEGIRNDYATAAGFAAYRIYDDDYDPPTPELWPCTVGNVRNEWVNGYGIVTWATHGSPTGASGIFDTTSTGYLDDSKPAFTFQASCLTGFPENPGNLGYALLREGAVATVSASRVSWEGRGAWTFNPADGSNHNFAYFYTKKIMDDGTPKPAGVALYLTKGAVPDVGMNSTDYNLYGDPDCYLLATIPNSPPVADAKGPYTVECAGSETKVELDGTGSSDANPGDILTYSWETSCPNGSFDDPNSSKPTLSVDSSAGCFGCTVTLTVTDFAGASDTSSAQVNIHDTKKPVITCPADITIECDASTGPPNTGIATAIDECDANPAMDYSDNETPGACPQAKTIIRTWTATDSCSNEISCKQTIQVEDSTPPVIQKVTANPNALWPPNHNMVKTTVVTVAADNCDATPECSITEVSSNEPQNGLGDGDQAPDWIITGNDTVDLRAERSGTGDGRIYTITVTCKDDCGNNSSGTTFVKVEHNQ